MPLSHPSPQEVILLLSQLQLRIGFVDEKNQLTFAQGPIICDLVQFEGDIYTITVHISPVFSCTGEQQWIVESSESPLVHTFFGKQEHLPQLLDQITQSKMFDGNNGAYWMIFISREDPRFRFF